MQYRTRTVLTCSKATTDNQPESQSPFLDLAAELRNRVYSHVARIAQEERPKLSRGEGERYDLAAFLTPTIGRASKQLRSEFLPVFFAEGSFNILAFTNIRDRYNERTGSTVPRTKQAEKDSGVLGIRRCVKKFLSKSGEAAIFRDVVIEVFDGQYKGGVRRGNAFYRDIAMLFSVELSVKEGRGSVIVVPRQLQLGNQYTRSFEQTDVDAVVAGIRSAAEEALARIE